MALLSTKFCFIFLILNYLIIIKCSTLLEALKQLVEENVSKAEHYQHPIKNVDFITAGDAIKDPIQFDYVIIGAGSSGSLIAKKLGRCNTLLLEAGEEVDEFSKIPGMAPFLQNSEMNWGYRSVPQKSCCLGMKGERCLVPRGKAVGGSGAINAMVYTRGHFNDYNNMGFIWSWGKVAEVFERIEGFIGIEKTGPSTEQFGLLKRVLGMEKIDFNIVGNKRFSGSDLLEKSGVLVRTKSLVTRIMIEGNRTVGVEYVKGNGTYRVFSKEVILSAGALNSPQILMLSGIGDGDRLSALGIPVKLNNSNVGNHLQDHPGFVFFTIRTNLSLPVFSRDQILAKYLENQRPLTAGFNLEGIAFLNVTDSNVPDLELAIYDIGESRNFYNLKEEEFDRYRKALNHSTDFGIMMALLHPKSRGKVSLSSKNPLEFPEIDLGFFQGQDGERDLEVMYKGVEFLYDLIDSEEMKRINASILIPFGGCGKMGKERGFWDCIFRRFCTALHHGVGTTRMGRGVGDSVVDGEFRVHGVEGLRVGDIGVVPEVVSGHTNALAFLVGEMVSDSVKCN